MQRLAIETQPTCPVHAPAGLSAAVNFQRRSCWPCSRPPPPPQGLPAGNSLSGNVLPSVSHFHLHCPPCPSQPLSLSPSPVPRASSLLRPPRSLPRHLPSSTSSWAQQAGDRPAPHSPSSRPRRVGCLIRVRRESPWGDPRAGTPELPLICHLPAAFSSESFLYSVTPTESALSPTPRLVQGLGTRVCCWARLTGPQRRLGSRCPPWVPQPSPFVVACQGSLRGDGRLSGRPLVELAP